MVQAEPGVNAVGPVVAVLQVVTKKLAPVPGVQAATSVGPWVTVLQLVVRKLAFVPGVQLPGATKVGPVFVVPQVMRVNAPGALGVQLPGVTPTVDVGLVQIVAVNWLSAVAAMLAGQDPGTTATAAVLLLVQVVTVKSAAVPDVQVATGVGGVGPDVAHVVAM